MMRRLVLTSMYSFLFLRVLSHHCGDDEEKEKTIMPRLTSYQDVFFLFLRALSHRYGDDEEKDETIMPRLTSDQDVFFSPSSRPQPSTNPFL